MATKVLYIGNGKWCYTKNCTQHAREISLTGRYEQASLNNNLAEKKRIETELAETPVGVAALRYEKVKEFRRVVGRDPQVGLDIDNTAGDFTDGMRTYTGLKRQIPQTQWAALFPDPTEYAMWEGNKAWYADSKAFQEDFREAEKDGVYLKMPVYDQVPETIRELNALGIRIRSITARDAAWGPDSQAWFNAHTIKVQDISHFGHKKEKMPDIDAYLDDSPQVIKRLLDHDKNVIIKDQDYNNNIEHPNAKRVTEWGDNVTDAVFDMLEKVKAKHSKS